MSLLGIQDILTAFALFLHLAVLLRKYNKFQRHGIPLKWCSTCVTDTVIGAPSKLLGVLILNEKTRIFESQLLDIKTELKLQSKSKPLLQC